MHNEDMIKRVMDRSKHRHLIPALIILVAILVYSVFVMAIAFREDSFQKKEVRIEHRA